MPRSLLRWLCSGADGVAGQCVDAGWLSGDIWTSDAFSGSIRTSDAFSGDISPVLSLGAYRSCPTIRGASDCRPKMQQASQSCPRMPGTSDCRPRTPQASGFRPRRQCPCTQTAAQAAGRQQGVCPPVRFTKKGPAKPGLSGAFKCEASASPPMRGGATSRQGCRSQSS